jgi:hypothetical protein
MKNTYIDKLEQSLHDLITMLTDPSLYNFLSESERVKLGTVLSNLPLQEKAK